MANENLYGKIGVVPLLEPADLVATDTLSALLDTRNFRGANINVWIGALTGVDASNHLVPSLLECDTTEADDFTAVDAADMLGAFTKVDATTEDSVVQTVSYIGTKRYVRVKLDYTGTGITAGIVGVWAEVGLGRVNPVVAPAAVAST